MREGTWSADLRLNLAALWPPSELFRIGRFSSRLVQWTRFASTMICQRCLRRSLRSIEPSARQFSSSARRRAQGVAPTPRPQVDGPLTTADTPPATSTSAAQPFSVPLSASPTGHGLPSKPKASPLPTVVSSVAAGTPLKGLNFMKGKEDPVAMEDHEYPDWLWRVLERKKVGGEEAVDGDIFCASFSSSQFLPSTHARAHQKKLTTCSKIPHEAR
jgi:Mitochondrial ribosomal protein L37